MKRRLLRKREKPPRRVKRTHQRHMAWNARFHARIRRLIHRK